MAMLITSIAKIRECATPEGFALFCQEEGVSPETCIEPEEGVMVSEYDLYRYGAAGAARELRNSTDAFREAAGLR